MPGATCLAQHAWRCFASLASTNIQQGWPADHRHGYVHYRRSRVFKVAINSGSMAYGETILGDRLDPGAVALKISTEPAEQASCQS
jgi:hypothetical protein